ncbi:extended synaptotagmin-2 isoform X2 [Diachasmimorpha longicaudata]|uniref:extended synaptotagmin-2 isoform X2 n=1 Tax=Diachasmimorpha longicaudata TaxID=58733 RepID=UPI0030B8BE4A
MSDLTVEKEVPKVEEAEEEKMPPTSSYMTIGSFTLSLLMKLAAVGVIWSFGYMRWSVAWLLPPVFLSVWKYESSKNNELKRLTAQATVLANEKDVITNRMNDLPSWVYFPDFDRAEWLNKVLYKIWPGMNHFVRNLVMESIKPAIVQALSEYKMPGFQFERLVLGRIPPKIYGIKTYEKDTSRNEIILDCEVLYAGDCDISFTLGTFKGGIRDFQLRGMLRIVLKPMLTVMPLVGGVQIFFLNNPEIDFNLVGAADILDFPGLKQALRKVIKEQFGRFLVLPHKLIIPLRHDIPAEILKMPEPEGILRIHVVQAKHLMKKDIGVLGKGKSDPYAIIGVGSQEFRTKTIDNTVDPKWDFWCEFIVEESAGASNTVITRLFDKDNTGTDDPLGRATTDVSRVKEKGIIDTWFTLEFAKHGMVHLRMMWLSLSKNPGDLQAALMETQQLRVTSMGTALLTVFIDSAKNLPCLRGSKQPDVFLEAAVGSKTERTSTMLRSCDPIWEQGFSFLVANPETNNLNIRIVDEKTGSVVGVLVYNIANLLTKVDMEDMQQPYDLVNASPESKLIMSTTLRILKYDGPKNVPEDEEDEDINALKRRIDRQESNISGSQSSSMPSTPLKKQMSKESLQSSTVNPGSDQGGNLPETVDEGNYEETITPTYASETNLPPGLLHRHPSVMSSAGEFKLGRIQLTLRYSVPRQKLMVVVHKISNLPLPHNDPTNIPDPYVKLYLLPDKHKETKRKTVVMKDNCNPIYDEQFEYIVSQGDLNSRTLEISVCTQKAWLSTGTKVMGQVHLNLAEIDVSKATSAWYDLVPEVKD